MYGSEFSISGKFTIPYSLFDNVDYANLGNLEEYKRQNEGTTQIPNANGQGFINPGDYIDANGNKVETFQEAAADVSKVDQKRFNWLEYYKIKFKADWFTKIYGKLVLRTLSEFGYLGAYNNDRGIVPFERFFVGGDGLANFAQDGREIVQLRGYPNNSLSSNNGGPIYNKFSLEMRFPVTLKAAASIYILGFVEGGNAYETFSTYNPFQLKRSAGAGLRIFMPAFGLLGIDFGYGFDPLTGQTKANGLETHFIIGQQF